MDDKEIVDLYLARNETAISETAKKYGRMLKSIAYSILKNHSDSEECENDTYLAAWNSIPPQIPRVLASFLGRLVRNISINRYEYYTADKRNREFEVTLSELDEIRSSENPFEEKYEISDVSNCISSYLLSKSYTKRVIFVRRYWYCDSINKIASDYGFSESKVKSMLMRMRKELKVHLERSGFPI